MHDGNVVPTVVALSHERDIGRLACITPAALPHAEVIGDPCLDRMRRSMSHRSAYRRALGGEPGSRIVTVSSTWGPNSLLGRHPDLIDGLLSELPMDRYLVAAVVHPNVWFAHGPWQLRLWLAEALRSGLRLIPPIAGWQQAIVAADLVIGDHGAVTGYAAALQKPTLLASFPTEEVASDSVIDMLGRTARRLDLRASLQPQVEAAIADHDPSDFDIVSRLASSRPDRAAEILRATAYRLLNLAEPDHPAVVHPYPSADVVPYRDTVQSCWIACEWSPFPRRIQVYRWPADIDAKARRGPRAHDAYLAVHAMHARRDLLSCADVIVVPMDSDTLTYAELAQTLRQHVGCHVAVASLGSRRYLLRHRQAGDIDVHCSEQSRGPMDSASIAVLLHETWLRGGLPAEQPLVVTLATGTAEVRVDITIVQSFSA